MRYKESLRDLSLHAAGSAFAWNSSALWTTFTVFTPLSPSLQDGRNLYSKQSHVYYYYYYYYYFSCFWWESVVTWLTAKFQVQLVPQRFKEHDGIGKKNVKKFFLKSSIAVGDIAFWNELMFLKLVTKWQEIQKSKNSVVVRFFFKKTFTS